MGLSAGTWEIFRTCVDNYKGKERGTMYVVPKFRVGGIDLVFAWAFTPKSGHCHRWLQTWHATWEREASFVLRAELEYRILGGQVDNKSTSITTKKSLLRTLHLSAICITINDIAQFESCLCKSLTWTLHVSYVLTAPCKRWLWHPGLLFPFLPPFFTDSPSSRFRTMAHIKSLLYSLLSPCHQNITCYAHNLLWTPLTHY